MSGGLIWVIAAVILVVIGVVIAVVVIANRGKNEREHLVDPPYGRKGVDNPTTHDPQLAPGVEPDGARFVEDPDAIRNPMIDGEPPGQSTPGTFPPPGPPRE